MFKRFYSILCLIFLFAFSQQAAIAHEISHIQEHTQKSQSHKSDLSSCTQCIGFAKLQHINDSEFVFNLEELNHYTVFVVQSNSYESLTAIHFAARAPPQTSTLN
jgi:excinuclease UvrABC ATPase subunit